MKRAIAVTVILLAGSLVLWAVIAQGVRVWQRYGLLPKGTEMIPEPTTAMPVLRAPAAAPLIALAIAACAAAVAIRLVRGRARILGIVPVSALVRHLVILGPTGSGKTSVAKETIRKALKAGVNVTVIDWKGEYPRMFPGATIVRKVALWEVPGNSPMERAINATEMIKEMMRDAGDLPAPSTLLLLKKLVPLYQRGTPTTKDVQRAIEDAYNKAVMERNHAEIAMTAALLRRLYILEVDEDRRDDSVAGNPKLKIYDLSPLRSVYLKSMYALRVLTAIYKESIAESTESTGLKMLVICEESQNIIHPRREWEPPGVGERIVYELRSAGVGVVLICPDPELLPPSITLDVGTIISTTADTLPRFVLERHLFRAGLEEAERTWKQLMRAKTVVVHDGRLHFRGRPKPMRRPFALPPAPTTTTSPPTPMGPTGDRQPGSRVGSPLHRGAPPISPHRSPGRPEAPRVVEVIESPKVVEIREEIREAPKGLRPRASGMSRRPQLLLQRGGRGPGRAFEMELKEEDFEEVEAPEQEAPTGPGPPLFL
ncbi:MAG: DUF87 domain-containing protein [Nitrososphaerota archaeon]